MVRVDWNIILGKKGFTRTIVDSRVTVWVNPITKQKVRRTMGVTSRKAKAPTVVDILNNGHTSRYDISSDAGRYEALAAMEAL